MAVTSTPPASIRGATNFSTKWHTKRIHRKLDDRDDVLAEAFQILEEHDTAVFPVISSIVGFSASQAGSTTGGTINVNGAGCDASSTVSLVIGGTSIAVTAGANVVTVDVDGDVDAVIAAAAVGAILPVYLRVDGVLCPTVSLIVTA
jgi:hypothetical protein